MLWVDKIGKLNVDRGSYWRSCFFLIPVEYYKAAVEWYGGILEKEQDYDD